MTCIAIALAMLPLGPQTERQPVVHRFSVTSRVRLLYRVAISLYEEGGVTKKNQKFVSTHLSAAAAFPAREPFDEVNAARLAVHLLVVFKQAYFISANQEWLQLKPSNDWHDQELRRQNAVDYAGLLFMWIESTRYRNQALTFNFGELTKLVKERITTEGLTWAEGHPIIPFFQIGKREAPWEYQGIFLPSFRDKYFQEFGPTLSGLAPTEDGFMRGGG